MQRIGFSTGALARGDFHRALQILRLHRIEVVELSALREFELAPLADAIPCLDLSGFSFVSVHAPSRFPEEEETRIVKVLEDLAGRGFPVVVHPDVIYRFTSWRKLGRNLLIENMDKRKPAGRTVDELTRIFAQLPEARFCFDIGHARQVDPSMTEAALLIETYGDRLAEIHMSEVNTASQHVPISHNAVSAFRGILGVVPVDIPIVLEPLIDQGQSEVAIELRQASLALAPQDEWIAQAS